MLLHGAFLPPPAAIEEVLAVVRSVDQYVAEEEPAVSRGFFGRRGHRKGPSEAPVTGPEMLEVLLHDAISLPITAFGNLTPSDVQAVVGTLGAAASEWSPPTVRLSGGTALDFPGDWNVWARLAGETDELAAIARGVTRAVEPLGLFVDRRAFRPLLAVARVNAATTGPYLESVVAALDAFEGAEWVVRDVALTTIAPGARGSTFTEYRRIPLTR